MRSLLRGSLSVIALSIFATGSVGNELNAQRSEYLRLVEEKKKAEEKEKQASAKLTAVTEERLKLARDRETLVNRVLQRRNELQKKFQENSIELKSLGAAQEELKPRWDRIVEFPNQYSSSTRREVRTALQNVNQKIEAANRVRDDLKRQLDEITNALLQAELDPSLTNKLTTLSGEIERYSAELALFRDLVAKTTLSQNDVLKAFARESAGVAPIVLNTVSIDSGNTRYYTGTWTSEPSEQAPPDRLCGLSPRYSTTGGADPSRAAQEKYLDLIAELTATQAATTGQIAALEAQIKVMDDRADEFVKETIRLNTEFAEKYAEIADLENSILIVNTLVEVGVVLGEVALTGGAATVARTGIEIGAEQAGKIAARRMRQEFGSQVAEKLAGQPLVVAKRNFTEIVSRNLPQEIVQEKGMEAIRKQAAEIFDDVTLKTIQEYSGKRMLANAANIKLRKAIVAGGVAAAPDAPDTAMWRGGEIILADAAEFALDRGMQLAAYGTSEVMKNHGANWKRAAGVLGNFRPDAMSDLLPKHPADILGFVGTAGKAAFAAGIGIEVDSKTREASILMAQSKALAVTYDKLFRDRLDLKNTLKKAQTLNRNATAEVAALRAGRDVSRRLFIEDSIAMTDTDKTYKLTLTFSDPIVAAPTVTLGGVSISFEAQGPAGSDTWSAELDVKDFIELGGFQTLSVRANDASGRSIDASPTSLGLPKLAEEGFHFYDQGADECHKIEFDLNWPVTLNFDGIEKALSIGARRD